MLSIANFQVFNSNSHENPTPGFSISNCQILITVLLNKYTVPYRYTRRVRCQTTWHNQKSHSYSKIKLTPSQAEPSISQNVATLAFLEYTIIKYLGLHNQKSQSYSEMKLTPGQAEPSISQNVPALAFLEYTINKYLGLHTYSLWLLQTDSKALTKQEGSENC